MPTLTTRRHSFGSNVSLRAVEGLLLEWDPSADHDYETTLDLRECRHVERGADFRLANALRRWSAGRIIVLVSSDTDTQSSAWFRLFTRSGLGRAIALHAHAVLAGSCDIRDELREYYGDSTATHAINSVMFANLESGAIAPTIERFDTTLTSALRQHVVRAHRALGHDDLDSLTRLAQEAVTNVVDHAFNAPWQEVGAPLSYLSVSWYKTITAAGDELGGVRRYLDLHHARRDPTQPMLGWLEIVVADDGVGVAARQHQLDESVVYRGDVSVEDAALLEAMSASATVKLRTLDCEIRGDPGLGTTIILKRLGALGAYAALRTGRRVLEFDPYRSDAFELRPTTLGWMPGTAVQALIPIRDPQLRLA